MRFGRGRSVQVRARLVTLQVVLAALMLNAFAKTGWAQTMARPRWAGSGLTVERWWQQAVLYQARPSAAEATGPSTLEELTARLDDLQALGVDAILLREVDASASALRNSPARAADAGTGSSAPPLDARFGTIEQFDRLMTEASRRRLRILVELPGATLTGDALVSRARFWLSRGVTGLYLSSAPALAAPSGVATDQRAQVRALRAVLHGFVGERVLLGDADAGEAATRALPSDAPFATAATRSAARGRSAGRERTIHTVQSTGRTAADTPDLLLRPLRGLGAAADAGLNLAALRGSLEALATHGAGAASVSEIVRSGPPADAARARAEVTVLLSARGGVALGAEVLGKGGSEAAGAGVSSGAATGSHGEDALAGGAATADPLFAWTSRMVGLHRGNATMRDGVQTVLNHDADGALVVVWRGGGARPQVLVEIVNLTERPVSLSLVDDIAELRLRGSFLRTVLRSDGGMGAMPLRAVRLPGRGVYLGELGR